MAAVTAAIASGSLRTQSWWRTPSSSYASPTGSSSVGSKVAVTPSAMERPQIGERLARVACSRSRRSLFGLGSVCSWGRMSLSSPGSASPSSPMTPVVARPAVSVMRYG